VTDVQSLLRQVPPDVRGICSRLRERGKRSWIVGGCVRDLLRGAAAKDWDIATDALPAEVLATFRKVIPTGLAHGTVTVLVRGEHYEVTTLRGEGAYSDGRHPDQIEFVDDIGRDLERRDFTMNAIALDVLGEKLIDPTGGALDLENRIIRAVGTPGDRFAEDGLRILRAARFAATLECSLDPETERAMGQARSLDTFRKVSAERVREEWLKAMLAKRPSVAFDLMRTSGILPITCPEMMESVDCEQNKWHAFDVWGHAMACLDALDGGPILRVAALLHDVGKPRTRAFSDKTKDFTFYDHERVGAEMAYPILTRMKFSNDERAHIVALVRHHLICYTPSWSDAGVRRWLRRVSPALAPDLYRLGLADALGKGKDATSDIQNIEELSERAARLMEAGNALSTRDLAIDGNTLMKELGLRPGRIIGLLLHELLEQVLEDPEKNRADTLLQAARQSELLVEAQAATKPASEKSSPG